ncbi:MAG TPA: PilN domain-containing protein [Gemmatimonadaceae bacterium]|nr:PilN domain-containing protein [Gemmatimonadaceae bacterium]
MTPRVGLELTHERVRALTVGRWGNAAEQSFEIRWDPRAPGDAAALLRKQLGNVDSIALSIGLEFTHVKNVSLPPVSAEERRKILTLEPDRFFAIDSETLVVAIPESGDLVFGADSSLIESWIAAFSAWAPVEVVEPSPLSYARALKAGRVKSGLFEIPGAANERGLMEVVNGSVAAAWRADDTPGSAQQLPSVRGVAPQFLAAYGAAIGFGAAVDGMLFPPAGMKAMRRQRGMDVVRAAINLGLALAFALAAIDRSRTRVLEAGAAEIASLSAKAEGPAAIRARLAQLDLESQTALSAASAHSDPVAILAAISRRLPHDAVVMSVRADGDEWQVDGTAAKAANIVPALDADPRLDNVRFLSASSHFNEGSRTYETFSVAMHASR